MAGARPNSTAWARHRSACRSGWNRPSWCSSSTANRALKGIESGNFKIGGNAGITVVTLSGGAEGDTTLHGGDIVVWTSATGAYGGLTFNGSVIKADDDENAKPLPAADAAALRHNLGTVW
jgi:hypothetical protein